MNMELPSFLDRRPKPENPIMTNAAPAAAKPRKKRTDAYVARATISIPIDSSDPASFQKAVEAIDGLLAELPSGSTMEFASRSLGKMEAA